MGLTDDDEQRGDGDNGAEARNGQHHVVDGLSPDQSVQSLLVPFREAAIMRQAITSSISL